jgi:hypothetical protein
MGAGLKLLELEATTRGREVQGSQRERWGGVTRGHGGG